MIKLLFKRYSILVYLVLLFLAMLIVYLALSELTSLFEVKEETLYIDDSSAVFTQYEYSGWITLTIEGKVEQSAEFVHDIFYRRTIKPYIERFHILEIDNVDPFSIDSPPEYNTDHRYRFLYRIDDVPHRVSIQIKSKELINSSSSFVVEVSSKNKVYTGGR